MKRFLAGMLSMLLLLALLLGTVGAHFMLQYTEQRIKDKVALQGLREGAIPVLALRDVEKITLSSDQGTITYENPEDRAVIKRILQIYNEATSAEPIVTVGENWKVRNGFQSVSVVNEPVFIHLSDGRQLRIRWSEFSWHKDYGFACQSFLEKSTLMMLSKTYLRTIAEEEWHDYMELPYVLDMQWLYTGYPYLERSVGLSISCGTAAMAVYRITMEQVQLLRELFYLS